ncbi:MAG: alpha/beta hydrolase [Anaerolineales bacterium]
MHDTQPLHAGMGTATLGPKVEDARAAVILIHGRGANAESILQLGQEFGQAEIAYLAPQARGGAWYPQRFIAPLEANEPWLTSALEVVDNLVQQIEAVGIPAERIVIGGFSQGACLAVEYIARNARRYGGAFAYSGGLIGPEGMTFQYPGNLAGTPVFLGCSDTDFHIPLERVKESTTALQALGGQVTERIYAGMGHTVNLDEIEFVQQMLTDLR